LALDRSLIDVGQLFSLGGGATLQIDIAV